MSTKGAKMQPARRSARIAMGRGEKHVYEAIDFVRRVEKRRRRNKLARIARRVQRAYA